MENYVVACLDIDDTGMRYVLATRRVFATAAEAHAYAATVNASRMPIVIGGRWHQLRFPVGTTRTLDGVVEA